MTPYLGHAPARTEFAARDVLEAMDITCIVPRKVEMQRHRTHHKFSPVTLPAIPGLICATMTPAQWHQAAAEGVMRTVKAMDWREWAMVLAFNDRIEMDYQTRMAQIERGERISPYDMGEALQIISGPLMGMMGEFRAMVEGALIISTTIFGAGREVAILPGFVAPLRV